MAMTILPGWWRAGPTTPDPGARPFSGVTAGEAGKSAIATSPHRHIVADGPVRTRRPDRGADDRRYPAPARRRQGDRPRSDRHRRPRAAGATGPRTRRGCWRGNADAMPGGSSSRHPGPPCSSGTPNAACPPPRPRCAPTRWPGLFGPGIHAGPASAFPRSRTPTRCPGFHRAFLSRRLRPERRTQPAPADAGARADAMAEACADRGYTPVPLPLLRAAERRRDARRVFIAPPRPTVFVRNTERSRPRRCRGTRRRDGRSLFGPAIHAGSASAAPRSRTPTRCPGFQRAFLAHRRRPERRT